MAMIVNLLLNWNNEFNETGEYSFTKKFVNDIAKDFEIFKIDLWRYYYITYSVINLLYIRVNKN